MSTISDHRVQREEDAEYLSDTVTVVVGWRERSFHLHSKILANNSGFFEAALKKCWEEGKQRVVTLPEDDETVFSNFVRWLYTRKIHVQNLKPEDTENNVELVKMFALGEKLLASEFQDRVIDTIVAFTRDPVVNSETGVASHWFPVKGTVNNIYTSLPEGSPLRKLVVDMHTRCGLSNWISDEPGFMNHAFLVDLSRALFDKRAATPLTLNTTRDLFEGSPCTYHKHKREEPCPGSSKK